MAHDIYKSLNTYIVTLMDIFKAVLLSSKSLLYRALPFLNDDFANVINPY